VWNICPILQGLASSIPLRIIVAISGLGNTFDDVDRSPDGMPVKRSCAAGWIGHLNHDKFPIIAGQWKTFENLTRDTRKSDLRDADGTVDRFTHRVPSLIASNRSDLQSNRCANEYGDASRKQQGPHTQHDFSALLAPNEHAAAVDYVCCWGKNGYAARAALLPVCDPNQKWPRI
jgi:hypothetical protein